ncbi:GH32 C-terminal domain-containing protein [Kitasatospora misakiensis]|uniref:GH32 C-terminal domain-containing protein n=1 Tax=Kitasatospora misakiensis TaxID=67330 RepID=A0ABW0WUG2_9ACTN
MPAPRRTQRTRRTRRLLPAVLATAVCLALTAGAPAVADAPGFQEPYRPQTHYTPAQNWMNDPNGLVYYSGEYHLFYQYNPDGNSWGNMSWGHAVSTDLVHWNELPLAIPHDSGEMVFSGSVVVDTGNTSGFGSATNPAMVAVYTSAYPDGKQAQSLAYSTDRGRTWTKYAGNPVLDIGSQAFRDPKVQWYAPTRSWLMTVVMADEHKVVFYTSRDLKSWTRLSEFGPAGATGGAWECPDLFPLAVDGDPARIKWVLVVSLNPGGIAGGSGMQYFLGDFDGTTFTPDDNGSYTPPSGTVVQDFEQPGYGGWTTGGTAFGTGPATGSLPGQSAVTGVEGAGYANSFHGGDSATGTVSSPLFTVASDYLNFKVGGGNHPHDPNTAPDRQPAPAGTVLADFEGDTYGAWTATGTAFGAGPARGTLPDQQEVSGHLGRGLVNSYLQGDATTGELTSPPFTVDRKYLDFLIGGGNHPASSGARTAIELLVDGKAVRSTTGGNDEHLDWASWDVSDLRGRTARIRIVDQNTGGWGHINVDQIVLSDTRALPQSHETSVNLVVDGRIVQSVTGADSEHLDWASFDLRAYRGKQARVQITDLNTDGWGHIMADRFTAADKPALSVLQRAHWVDFGKDFYAAVTYNDAPRGERVMIGWMSNWQYSGSTPTTPWRNAQSLPRTLQLRTVDGRLQLTQQPVAALGSLRQGPAVSLNSRSLPAGTTALPAGSAGQALDIDATFTPTFSPTGARTFGLKVRTGAGQETVIGYDTTTQQLYVDRTRSGAVDFDPHFPGVQSAPLKPQPDGKVHLRVVVDSSSVEVFGGQGEAVITDQIFPDPDSQGVQLFAEGGPVRLDGLKLWHLGSYRSR